MPYFCQVFFQWGTLKDSRNTTAIFFPKTLRPCVQTSVYAQAVSEISQIHNTPCTALRKTSQSSLIYQQLCNWIQRRTPQVKQSLGYCITYQVNVSLLLKQRPKAPGNPHFVVESVFMNWLRCSQLPTREPSKDQSAPLGIFFCKNTCNCSSKMKCVYACCQRPMSYKKKGYIMNMKYS